MSLGNDVRDILELEMPGTSNHESTFNFDMFRLDKKKSPKKQAQNVFKRPEGMKRELYALLYSDNKDVAPLVPTISPLKLGGYKSLKAKLGFRKVRPWRWQPFHNSARKDNLKLHHWQRVEEENKPYAFAHFNKVLEIPKFTEDEYTNSLQSDNWTKDETIYLLSIAAQFDLRWPVILDRWDRDRFPTPRSIECLKERYYDALNALSKARAADVNEVQLLYWDAEHERRRKEQLEKLYNRTKEEVKEEEELIAELKRIEARRRERERKAQDLQRLIQAAENVTQVQPGRTSVVGVGAASASTLPLPLGIADRRKRASKHHHRVPSGVAGASVASGTDMQATAISEGIRWPEFKGPGISLMSQRMKLSGNLGQRRSKAIEQLVEQLGLEWSPMPTSEIVEQFNSLRSDLLLLYELRSVLASCQYDLESLRHQYLALTGQELPMPAKLTAVIGEEGTVENVGASNSQDSVGSLSILSPIKKKLNELMESAGGINTPSRKRKAALEQQSILKKLRIK